jgi:hypothetical protein
VKPSALLCRLFMPAALCIAVLTACAGDTPAGVVCDVSKVPTLAIGVQVNGAMEDGDCTVDGDPGDAYRLSLTGITVFNATLSSDKYAGQLYIEKNTGVVSNDGDVVFESGKPARVQVLLPAGEYIMTIQSDNNVKGAYTLTTSAAANTGCPQTSSSKLFTVTGLGIVGSFAADDCKLGNGAPTDGYFMKLKAGQPYTISVNSTLPFVHLETALEGAVVAGGGSTSTNGKLSISYTPTKTAYYLIGVSTNLGVTGGYTLTVTP